jgi:hypothetical protein
MISDSASSNLKLEVFDLNKKSRRFPARRDGGTGRLATGDSLKGEGENPARRPEHPYARRSKGCKVTHSGRSPDLERKSYFHFSLSSQWRDRAGFTPASLFSPLFDVHGAPGRIFLKRAKENSKTVVFLSGCGADVITLALESQKARAKPGQRNYALLLP